MFPWELTTQQHWSSTDTVHVYRQGQCHPKDWKLVPAFMAATGTVFKTKPLHINVIGKQSGPLDVIDLVEKTLIKAGMERVFAE
jgi:hypothetical protein